MRMVPAIVSILTINVTGNLPVSAEFSCWYNPLTVVALTVLAAIAVYGFWRSQTTIGGVQAATER
jgi:hypothetical protein